MKTFTLDEANALLPALESLLRAALESKEKLLQAQKDAHQLAYRVFLSGGSLLKISDLLAQKAAREQTMQRLKDAVAEIDSIGVQVKDLSIGLLDFPCNVDGEIILLCWKLGEPRITHWHGLEEGFKGRKPINDRIARQEPDLPN
jgi:hypothetical protein